MSLALSFRVLSGRGVIAERVRCGFRRFRHASSHRRYMRCRRCNGLLLGNAQRVVAVQLRFMRRKGWGRRLCRHRRGCRSALASVSGHASVDRISCRCRPIVEASCRSAREAGGRRDRGIQLLGLLLCGCSSDGPIAGELQRSLVGASLHAGGLCFHRHGYGLCLRHVSYTDRLVGADCIVWHRRACYSERDQVVRTVSLLNGQAQNSARSQRHQRG